jgi:hypothetical protein
VTLNDGIFPKMDRFKDLWNYDVIFVNELVDRSVLVGGKSL